MRLSGKDLGELGRGEPVEFGTGLYQHVVHSDGASEVRTLPHCAAVALAVLVQLLAQLPRRPVLVQRSVHQVGLRRRGQAVHRLVAVEVGGEGVSLGAGGHHVGRRGPVEAGGHPGPQRRVHRVDHAGTVHRLSGPAEGGRDLEQVGDAVHAGGAVVAGGVEHGRAEEHRVTGAQRQLHPMLGEVFDELGAAPRQVAQLVLVGVGQVHGGAGLGAHVAVGDGALQGEQRRQPVGLEGELLGFVVGEEAHVVVAVGVLGLAAGIDHVHLLGQLVAGSQPGLAGHRHRVGAVVVDEGVGVGHRQLLECVPHPVVGAGLGEVVAGEPALGVLGRDQVPEHARCPVHRLGGHGPFEQDDAGAVDEGCGQFGPQPMTVLGVAGGAVGQRGRVVGGDALGDAHGQRVVGRLDRLFDQRRERIQVAVVPRTEGGVSAAGHPHDGTPRHPVSVSRRPLDDVWRCHARQS